MKKVFIALIIFLITVTLLHWFSPYQNNDLYSHKAIINSIIIDKTPSEVFDYLGNSDNASNWSTYVDHITCLNSDTINDGSIGSIRRCFKNEDENGIFWDEETIEKELNTKRTLSIFNMNGFWMTADNLRTQQVYEEVDGKCKLSFTLYYEPNKASFWDKLKLSLTSYFVVPIFQGNIEQVKEILEKE